MADIVNQLCQAIRSILFTKDLSTYVNSILTTYVCQQPADYESALQLVMQVKASDPELVDDAIKYMIFLSDTNKLYDVALGLYDFNLVLLVAQHSQKASLFVASLKILTADDRIRKSICLF
jgi:elongator complex protein 1